MEYEISTNSAPRVRGGTERAIEDAYKNLGYAIVEDCCAEWLEAAERIKRLRIREKYKGLTTGQSLILRRSINERIFCELWLESDMCYDLCGYDGETLVENLKMRLKEKGY